MKRNILALALATVAMAVGAVGVRAADTVAADPTTHNLYFGTTISNGDFTVVNGIDGSQLGLRGDVRFGGPVAPTGSTYTFQTGGGTAATWDFVYSIDVSNVAGATLPQIVSNNLIPGSYSASISVNSANQTSSLATPSANDSLSDANHTVTFNPLPPFITDNDTPLTGNGGDNALALANGIAQNAENIGFGFLGFNPNVADVYTVTLSLTGPGGVVTTDAITVDVVATPLPASAWSGLALLGAMGAFGGLKRMRRQEA